MNKLPRPYLIFAALVMPVWILYMLLSGNFSLYQTYWPAPVTMIFGSFIAGASSEGGGAVAFPVFTLLLNIEPSVARNFSFAIQSIGMTAASLLIIGLRIPVEWRAVLYTTPGGVIGLLLGTWLIVPHVLPGLTKLFFVSLWLSFGFALWLINRRPDRTVHVRIAGFTTADKWKLIGFGFIGGGITSLFGNGIDIFTFCLLTLYFRISEKVATPTSVVIMTINTILGFAGHVLLWQDFGNEAFRYWLVSIPVALVFAPLGAWAINRLNRLSVAAILYTVMVVQYIGALFVIRPSAAHLLFSLLIIGAGIFLFTRLTANARPEQVIQ
jgi:uncharacterized membrane protein YfcA